MTVCLRTGSDAYLLDNGILCIKNKNGEYTFNDLSARFIAEIIKRKPNDIEEIQSIEQFKFKVQAHILKDWLLEREILVNINSCEDMDCTINEYKNKSIKDITSKTLKSLHGIGDKTISVETYYKRELDEVKVKNFTEKLGSELVNQINSNYPYTDERKPNKIRVILTETRGDNKILGSELNAKNGEICIPVISTEDKFEIGPMYTKTEIAYKNTIDERAMIKAGPSHEIGKGIPFIASNRFPITSETALSLASLIAYILDREFDERLNETDFDKVWSISYDKCSNGKGDPSKNLLKTKIHRLDSSLDEAMELRSKELKELIDLGKPTTNEIVDISMKIPVMDKIKAERKQKVSSNTDGGHRLLSTAETRRLLTPFVNDITGIIDKIELTSIDNDIFMYSAARVVGAATINPNNNSETARSTGYPISAAGKGRTTTQSQVSCIAEAIERYSANFPIFNPTVVKATCDELGPLALKPNEILNFSSNQYAKRNEINQKTHALIHKIPKLFDNHIETNWSPVVNLINPSKSKLLPTAMLGFNYRYNLQPGTAVSCSNGLASGNSKAEAMVQALYEIIERDACAIWWYNKLKLDQVIIPESIRPYVQKIENKIIVSGRTFEIIKLPTDFNVTVTCCISSRNNGRQVCVGLGSHHDPSVSISRAITEMYQMLVGIKRYGSIQEKKGMSNGGIDKLVCDWLNNEKIKDHQYLVANLKNKTNKETTVFKFEYIEEELEYILNQFNIKGFDVYGVNMTAESIGFPVIKIFVPGMRHFWPRLGEGRLYNVPVELGYLNVPKNEEEMNKEGFFF